MQTSCPVSLYYIHPWHAVETAEANRQNQNRNLAEMKVLDLAVEHGLPHIPLNHRPVTVKNGDGAGAPIVVLVPGEECRDGGVYQYGHVPGVRVYDAAKIRSRERKSNIATHRRKKYIDP